MKFALVDTEKTFTECLINVFPSGCMTELREKVVRLK